MSAPESFYSQIVDGFSQLLAADGIGFSVRSTADGTTGLYPMKLPLTPAKAVSVACYPLTNDPTLAQSEIGVQFTSRSAGDDIHDCWALDDAICKALMGRFSLQLPTSVDISSLAWTSGASLGQDDANRWRWVSNFTCSAHRPTPHRF